MRTLGHLATVRWVRLTTAGPGEDPIQVSGNRLISLAIVSDDVAYFVSDTRSTISQHLAVFPHARIAPCDVRGRPGGSDQPVTIEPATGTPPARAVGAVRKKSLLYNGILLPLWYRLRGRTPVYYLLRPAAEPTPWLDQPASA